ncbi:MAG: replicative DNA helicase [Erysipelothrix sp.]|nr:replicative DNA helicase [Erysipelothrix sp.]
MKTLPQSIEAEIAVLGALMIYPEIGTTVGQYALSADDFFKREHKIIFESITDVLDAGQSLSADTLITKLTDKKVLSDIGGIEYLGVIADGGATPTTFAFFVDNIQEKSQKRSLIQLTQSLEDGGFDSASDIQALLDKADQALKQISENRRVEEMQHGSDVIDEVYKQIKEYRESGSQITGLETGYQHLNKVTSGLQKGDLIILAARPSVGKTAFALNLALNIVSSSKNKEGKSSAAIFSLEMPAKHLMMRILSANSGVEGSKLRNGNLTDDELGQLARNVAELQKLNIFIDDNSSITMPEIFAKCRQLKSNGTLDIIIIDYIQLISSKGNVENRQQEVSDISRNLKLLAREMEVPVIALSQLSRLVERRENNMPQLSDLRESGSIEQDADIVMFLYRKHYHDQENKGVEKNMEESELLIRKHRNGALADIPLVFTPSINKFYSVKNSFEDES